MDGATDGAIEIHLLHCPKKLMREVAYIDAGKVERTVSSPVV